MFSPASKFLVGAFFMPRAWREKTPVLVFFLFWFLLNWLIKPAGKCDAMNLFAKQEADRLERAKPLAARMRPRSLDEFVGQQHFLGEGKLLRRMLAADRLSSVIFYGPPGTGKTSLAEIIAAHTRSRFSRINAAAAGVKELRALLDRARNELSSDGFRTVLFIDELHRFNKSQQDVLLPDVESGVVSLIGATTANPFFSLVSPLVSRSQIFEFRPLSQDDVLVVLRRAVEDSSRGLGALEVRPENEALEFLAEICDGDLRKALNALEVGLRSVADTTKVFDLVVAQDSIQQKAVHYDDDAHYDAASAFIKSIRGSDPDAAVYWLARMLEAGEDPRFLARRLVIAASEDIGNADPRALLIATAAAQAVEFVGMPECRISLCQATAYLATAPKSNASIAAVDSALSDVRNQRIVPVPMHLRDAHYGGAKQMGHGKGYQYAHNSPDGWVDQDYLGVEKTYYEPVDRGYEAEIQKSLEKIRQDREILKENKQ
jgi:putative ATPase